jgi:hypothetical protein
LAKVSPSSSYGIHVPPTTNTSIGWAPNVVDGFESAVQMIWDDSDRSIFAWPLGVNHCDPNNEQTGTPYGWGMSAPREQGHPYGRCQWGHGYGSQGIHRGNDGYLSWKNDRFNDWLICDEYGTQKLKYHDQRASEPVDEQKCARVRLRAVEP